MIYLIILAIIIITASLLLSNKEKVETKTDGNLPWIELISNFKTAAFQIKNTEELKKYLSDINDQVKNFETDYAFLVDFNSIIRQTRERLNEKG